jgi:hypothetical protein
MPTRDDRLARNQSRFSAANERLKAAIERRTPTNGQVPFLCECADDKCLESVELTLAEYEDLHPRDNVFVIVPGHPRIEREVVLQRGGDRFEQVEKPNEP